MMGIVNQTYLFICLDICFHPPLCLCTFSQINFPLYPHVRVFTAGWRPKDSAQCYPEILLTIIYGNDMICKQFNLTKTYSLVA